MSPSNGYLPENNLSNMGIIMETTLKVSGMHCTACKMLIEDTISEIGGAQALSVDHTTGIVTVSYDLDETLAKIKAAIRGEGFSV